MRLGVLFLLVKGKQARDTRLRLQVSLMQRIILDSTAIKCLACEGGLGDESDCYNGKEYVKT